MNSLRMSILISILLSASFAGAQIRTKSVKEKSANTISAPTVNTTGERAPRSKVRYVYVDETLADERASRRFNLNAGMIQYVYDEPGVMKITGPMVEVGGHARYYLKNSNSFFAGDLRWANGSSMHYDGGMQDLKKKTTTKHTSGSDDSIVNVQALYGTSLLNRTASTLEFFGGLGRWQLNNKIAGAGSYAREAIYLYFPMGINFATKASARTTFTAGLDLNIYISGQTTSKMSDVSPGSSDIIHVQPSGSGYKLKAGTEFGTGDSRKCSVGVYYQVWEIERSNIVAVNIGDGKQAYLVEPRNKTTMLGLNFGATF